jgi:hypothetical protein
MFFENSYQNQTTTIDLLIHLCVEDGCAIRARTHLYLYLFYSSLSLDATPALAAISPQMCIFIRIDIMTYEIKYLND